MRHTSELRRNRLVQAAGHALCVAIVGLSGPASAAAINWTLNADGFWDVPANWSSNPLLPGAADDVTLNVAGLVTVTYQSITSTVNSLTSQENLVVASGNLTVTNAFSNAGNTTISGGNLTLNGTSTLASLTHSSALLAGSGLVTVSGASSWTGGTHTGSGTTQFDAALSISGNGTKAITGTRTVTLNGTTTWSGNTGGNGNTISLASTATVNNAGSFSDSNAFNTSITGGTFNNSGSFDKQSNAMTIIGTVFNNTGTVNVNAGTMLMNAGGTSTGVFNVAAGALLEFRNGAHTLDHATIQGLGTFAVTTDNVGADAVVTINGGTLKAPFLFSGSTITGTDRTFQGPATWTGGAFSGTAVTTFGNDVTISGANTKVLVGGGTINLQGTTTWTGNTAANNNAIQFWNGGTINNNGTFNDNNAFASFIEHNTGGPHNFNNAGTYNKNANTITTVDLGVAFNNSGTVNVNAGTFRPSGGTSTGIFNIAAGAVLNFQDGSSTLNGATTQGAGTLAISTDNVGGDAVVAINGGTNTAKLALSGSTLTGTDNTFTGLVTWTGGSIAGAASTTFTNDVTISGANTKVLFGGRTLNLMGTTTWSGNTAANNNAIQFWNGGTLVNRGIFNDANAFASFIEHNVGGPHTFSNVGTYNKLNNTVTTVDLGVLFTNSGTLNLDAGTMRFFSGTTGPTGTVNVAAGATYQHDANSTMGTLHTAGTLNLGVNTLTIFGDYDNANFGSGNAFNRRANVVTSGAGNRLIAGGDANQGITGANISNGTSVNPTLVIGNVRVGANTFNYDIANVGTTGPALRGAIQTGVNGGNISDSRLSGTGVTAGNWGPVSTGNSVSRNVTITVGTAGVFAPLAGQAVNILNNFENTRSQLLTITSAAGAAAYNPAAASVTPNPVALANQRVGTGLTQALTISNTAPAGAFTEGLNASFSGTTGNATVNGGAINLLAGGASNNTAMRIGVDASSAGAKTGSATLNFASDGTGTSGLPLLNLASQTVNVSGNVYQVAAGQIVTAPLNFGTVQVGQVVSQNLVIRNSASGATGFVEDLNASFGAAGDARINGSGSLSGIQAGTSSTAANGTMTVTVNTAAAGVINSSIGVNFVSAGAVNGASNGLGTLGVGSENYGVAGSIQANVVDQAKPVINGVANPGAVSVNLGSVRIGAAANQALTVLNQATGNQQAALNGSIATNGAPVLAGGSFNLLAPGATSGSLSVGIDTSAAGVRAGSATVSLVSDASNLGSCAPNCQLSLPNQVVNVSADVYRLANPVLNTGTVTIAARVGDAVAANQGVSITNASPDVYTEGLRVNVTGTSGNAQGNGGSINNLAAQGTDSTSIRVGLSSTTAAGLTTGTVSLGYVSTGAGTTGAPDIAVGAGLVTVSGKVYTPAVAQIGSPSINFGIVHVGDSVAPLALNVANVAQVTALNDTLRASFGAVTGPFSGTGSIAGLAAGASDGTSMAVGLNTAAAGVFNGTGSVNLASHNADMTDLTLSPASLILAAQINNYANPEFVKTGGTGTLSGGGTTFALDLGDFVVGSGVVTTGLGVLNDVAGPADLVDGVFNLSSVDDFVLSGFTPFANLSAAQLFSGLLASFAATAVGSFDDTVVLLARGHNASGFEEQINVTLLLHADVLQQAAVPEPPAIALLLAALALVAGATRLRRPAR